MQNQQESRKRKKGLLAISDYAYVLADGRVELDGPSREVAQNEHVRKAYLGI